jgi:hypothetical protein
MRKAYFSLREWLDNSDGHLYREGEPFPFDGREIPEERLEALESGHNRAGLRLIQAEEVQDEPEEVRKEETPKKATEGRKTAPKKRTTKK